MEVHGFGTNGPTGAAPATQLWPCWSNDILIGIRSGAATRHGAAAEEAWGYRPPDHHQDQSEHQCADTDRRDGTEPEDRDVVAGPAAGPSLPLLELFRSAWLDGTGVGWQDPWVNLLTADLSGLPPIAVFWGADELVAGEAAEFARRAQAAATTC
jgi:hypothetical protein